MNIALLNTTIITGGEGTYTLQKITLEQARVIMNAKNEADQYFHARKSFIGHESTAQVMSTLLGVDVPMSREQFKQDGDWTALCFKLNGRPAEGKILTAGEIEEIGYEWYLLDMESSKSALFVSFAYWDGHIAEETGGRFLDGVSAPTNNEEHRALQIKLGTVLRKNSVRITGWQ